MVCIKNLLSLVLVTCALPACASITLVQAPAFGDNGVPQNVSFGSNNTAGNTLIAELAFVSAAIPTLADSRGNTWILAGCAPFTSVNATNCLWYAPNCKAGANTVTATWSATNNGDIMGIEEYSGLLVPAPSPFDNGSFVDSEATPWPETTLTIPVPSNELLIAYAATDYGSNGTWSGATSGFTLRGSYIGTSNRQMVVYDQQPAAGSYFWSINNTGGSNVRSGHAGLVAFRSAVPTIGEIQANQNSCTSVTSCSTTLAPYNVPAGDSYIASVFFSGSTVSGCVPVPSSNVSDHFKQIPTVLLANDLNLHRETFYVPNAVGGATTVTMTSTGCSQNFDLFVTQVHGLDHLSPLFNSGQGSGGTTLSMGPVSNATGMYVYADTCCVSSYSPPWSTTSGFAARLPIIYPIPSYNYISQTFDDVPLSSPVSFAATNINGGSASYGPIAVFSATNNTFIEPIQITTNGTGISGSSISAPTLTPVVAGNMGLVLTQYGGPSSSFPILDSQGNTWTAIEGCVNGVSSFCIAKAILSSSGIDTITVNPGQGVTFTFLELPPFLVDGHNSGSTASGTSQGTGNITTTHANDLVVTLCAAPTTGSVLTTPTLPSNSQLRSLVQGHDTAQGNDYDLIQAPISTYSSTCNTSTTTAIAAGIVALAPITLSTTQPQSSVVAMNHRSDMQ